VIARSRLFSTFGGAAVGGGLPLFYSLFSDGPADLEGRARIFLVMTIAISAAFLIYNYLMYTKVKERIISPPQQQQSFRSIFRSLLSNKLFFLLVASVTIQGVIHRGNTDLRLFEYNIGDPGWQTIIGLAGLPALLLATWIMPILCRYFEKRNIVIVSSAVRIIIRALYLFIGTRPGMFNLTVLNTSIHAKLFMAVFGFLNEVPNTIRGQLYWSMLADSVDYQEWKTNKRNDGTIYTMEGLAGKIVGSIGAASTGIIFGFIGFEAGEETQSAVTMRGLFTVPLGIELVSIAASAIPFFFYDLKRDSHAKMIEELKQRAAAAEPIETAM
jgi:Na+/melibiose symporter-like transporter